MKILVKFILLSSMLVSESFAEKGKLGLRYWHSEGETEWSHCASTACGGGASGYESPYAGYGDPTSKLNYSGTNAGIAEIFGTYTIDKILLMGTYGTEIADNDGGKLRDQDWLMDSRDGRSYTFSDTISSTRDTNVNYYTVDLGMTLDEKTTGMKIAPFLGYVRYNEKLSAYGLTFLRDELDNRTNEEGISNNTLVIKNDITWTGFRIGADVDYPLNKEFNLNLNAAYVFGLDAENKDSHVLRDDLGPTPNIKNIGDGGYGYMIDILGQYNYSTQLKFDFGYRWWMFDTDSGNTKFGPNFTTAFPNRSLKSERSGLLIGVNYIF
jgi:hypothetical protein